MQAEQFTRITHSYMDTVYRLALNYMKSPDSADDITQEVFLRLLRTETEFASEEHVRNWLIRVTINECKRDFAARWRKAEPLDAYADKLAFSTAENGETYQAVMGLPRKYRIVIHLHYYEGYSTSEIAQMLGSKRSTVCTQLERGRKLLKTMLLEANDA
jgi:RNA polymerase sigma-70 factor (ECF subfamily)